MLFYSEQMVTEESNHISFLNGGKVFRITRARVSDTDFYKCTASNRVGQTNKVGLYCEGQQRLHHFFNFFVFLCLK